MSTTKCGQTVAKEVSQAVAKTVAKGVAIFTGFVVFIVVGGFVVRLLWNWLLPPIFGLREVTFWQALGLLALCRILFGGFGRGGGSHARPPSRPPRMVAERRFGSISICVSTEADHNRDAHRQLDSTHHNASLARDSLRGFDPASQTPRAHRLA